MEVSGQPHSPVTVPLVNEPQVLTEQYPVWASETVGSIFVEVSYPCREWGPGLSRPYHNHYTDCQITAPICGSQYLKKVLPLLRISQTVFRGRVNKQKIYRYSEDVYSVHFLDQCTQFIDAQHTNVINNFKNGTLKVLTSNAAN